MGHGDYRSLILLQVLLQPVDTLGIEVVGWFVEEEYVGLLQEQAAECHTSALTSRQVGHSPVSWRTVECIHRTLQLGVDVPCVGGIDDILHLSLSLHQLVHLVGIAVVFLQSELLVDVFIFSECIIYFLHTLHHVLLHGFLFVKRWVLWQVAHRVSGTPHHLALRRLFQASDDFHQCRLTCTIQTDDADFCSVEER